MKITNLLLFLSSPFERKSGQFFIFLFYFHIRYKKVIKSFDNCVQKICF